MNPIPGIFSISRRGLAPVLLWAALAFTGVPRSPAQALRPAEITFQQSIEAPYRDSGRIRVDQSTSFYIGTASYIRRYTGLTAGHVLYSPKRGFSAYIYYDPALYIGSTGSINVNYFAVLSGYQAAADQDGEDATTTFDQDMGYLIFSQPAANDEWATWSDNTDDLLGSGPFLLFGYAAQSFTGDELASVQHQNPYNQLLAPALYENKAYYTEGGMSGGPVYVVPPFGKTTMVAINVAGTDYSDPADSLARAITPTETPLLLGAEYAQGIITGGIIKGPATLAAATGANYKTGLTFIDGPQVGNSIATQYDGDVQLVAKGSFKKTVIITKHMPGKYFVALPPGIPSGTRIPLELLRTALPSKGQKPLQTLVVTVK